MKKLRKTTEGLTTAALHSGDTAADNSRAIIPPLHLSTTFESGNPAGYEYSRSGNPTRDVLEKTLAALDGADYGLAYSSGSAALANVAALLGAGEEILFSTDAYGGTYRYIKQVLAPQGIGHQIADFTDLEATAVVAQGHPVKIIWMETPTNPLLKVADIAALADIAHQAGAWLVVDNTFATPALQRPLELGADIVVYSTTKYMNGHSDSTGGSLATSSDELYERLEFLQNAIGAIMSPFDAWLTLRGLRTLELRMDRHVKNAQALAAQLDASGKFKRIYYPGLFTGEQGRIVREQMSAPGAMISVELDEKYDVQRFLKALKYFPLAESLGGIDSLIDHPASMTHASIPKAEREKIGLTDGLFRISVGIENVEDLTADMAQALEAVETAVV
jgi:cystathionine beta-lyase/cystathionine gamma-synthase